MAVSPESNCLFRGWAIGKCVWQLPKRLFCDSAMRPNTQFWSPGSAGWLNVPDGAIISVKARPTHNMQRDSYESVDFYPLGNACTLFTLSFQCVILATQHHSRPWVTTLRFREDTMSAWLSLPRGPVGFHPSFTPPCSFWNQL